LLPFRPNSALPGERRHRHTGHVDTPGHVDTIGTRGSPGPAITTGMAAFVVHPVRPDVEVHITRPMPPLQAETEARIDALWAAASARVAAGGAGQMFNGRVFSIDTIAPDRITGHLSEYRRLVAQVEDHALFDELGIRSLAACGVLSCSGGVVIGRRPVAAIYQPGMWQLCPAGSVDGGAERADGTMDYRAQLRTELQEELGIGPEVIGTITPLCVVEHAGSHVSDLGMAVRTSLSPGDILKTHRSSGNGEYDPLRIVPVTELPNFIEWAGARLVPPAPIFLAHAGFLTA
jgi:hypothetical protein